MGGDHATIGSSVLHVEIYEHGQLEGYFYRLGISFSMRGFLFMAIYTKYNKSMAHSYCTLISYDMCLLLTIILL